MQSDRRLTAFKQIVPHLRGALWWIRNDLLKVRQPQFNQKDKHKGHPGLSVRKCEVTSVCDAVPMLFGTTFYGGDFCRNAIVAMLKTPKDPERRTVFGRIVEPAVYKVGELLDGVTPRSEDEVIDSDGERKEQFEYRAMYPNWHKPMVDENEMRQLEEFCRKHRLG